METEEVEEAGLGSVSVRNFLAARVQEINSLSLQVGSSGVLSSKGLAFQHVPKHMRRRAVSHNVKRLPQRIRQIHMNQVEKSSGSQTAKKPRPPGRKHRRRKQNLLEEYNRRQREHKWLETHIWHAKRFHMNTKWNYKIPFAPTDKGYRALYRAASNYSAMRDISFMSCLQLSGSFELISSKISSAFAPNNCNSLTVSAEMYKAGSREGSIYFYKKGTYPHGYIGKVKFNWMDEQKALWLWVHPAQKAEILQELIMEFELDEELKFKVQKTTEWDEESMEIDGSQPQLKVKMSIDEIKLQPKQLQERPSWKNQKANLVLTDLEGVLNRIRLYGPLSTSILKETLQVLTPETLEVPKLCGWMADYYTEDRLEILASQGKVWTNLKSYSEVPCHSIIPLTVRDPRVIIPPKRTKATHDGKPSGSNSYEDVDSENEDWDVGLDVIVNNFNSCALDAPLISGEVRNQLVQEKMSDAEFSKRRASLLIPGSRLDLGIDENQIPVMLIHRPSTSITTFQNGGWDLIIPAGWAMQFWVALSYRSVRACGYRDAMHYEFESGSVHAANEDGFPLAPDTTTGKVEAKESALYTEERYFKIPPAKRVNFIKFGCPFPFHISWSTLLRFNETSPSTSDNFYVLRDIQMLKKLSELARSKIVKPEEFLNLIVDIPDQTNCLVGFKLVTVRKGTMKEGAMVCLPLEADFENFKHVSPASNVESWLTEPTQDDSEAQEERRIVRQSHGKLLSFLSKKRRKLRYKAETGSGEVSIAEDLSNCDSAVVVEQFNAQMNDLWLPNSEEVLQKVTRAPLGFLIVGKESYAIARHAGMGYCTLSGLKRWFLETKATWNAKSMILYRNCRGTQTYRFARLEICQLS